jgi:hypothetical protein
MTMNGSVECTKKSQLGHASHQSVAVPQLTDGPLRANQSIRHPGHVQHPITRQPEGIGIPMRKLHEGRRNVRPV